MCVCVCVCVFVVEDGYMMTHVSVAALRDTFLIENLLNEKCESDHPYGEIS